MFYVSKFQYRNKNQNFISNFVFQFIKKTKWHFGYTDFTPFMLPLIWPFHSRNMKHYIKRIHESMVAHLVQNSCFCIQRKILIFRETFFYSAEVLYSVNFFAFQKNFIFKEMLLCSVTFLLYSDKLFIFRKEFVFKEAFHIQRKSLC